MNVKSHLDHFRPVVKVCPQNQVDTDIYHAIFDNSFLDNVRNMRGCDHLVRCHSCPYKFHETIRNTLRRPAVTSELLIPKRGKEETTPLVS